MFSDRFSYWIKIINYGNFIKVNKSENNYFMVLFLWFLLGFNVKKLTHYHNTRSSHRYQQWLNHFNSSLSSSFFKSSQIVTFMFFFFNLLAIDLFRFFRNDITICFIIITSVKKLFVIPTKFWLLYLPTICIFISIIIEL